MSDQIRSQVVDYLELLADQVAQLRYASSVAIAGVPVEMVSMFADDLFHPASPDFLAAFSADEVRDLAELYGRLCVASDAFSRDNVTSINDALKVPEYRGTMAFAKELHARLVRDA